MKARITLMPELWSFDFGNASPDIRVPEDLVLVLILWFEEGVGAGLWSTRRSSMRVTVVTVIFLLTEIFPYIKYLGLT
jgi:hypothetical protein